MITTTTDERSSNVLHMVLELEKALVQKDAAAMGQLLTEDFIGANPTGEWYTKNDYITFHCKPGAGIMALNEVDKNATAIRFYNDTAVINRRVRSQFKLPTGDIMEYDVQRIEVVVKKNNEWKIASGQGTKVIPIPQFK